MSFTFSLVKPSTKIHRKNWRTRNFLRYQKINRSHFTKGLQQGQSDWEVRLIDQGVSVDDLRRRESFWQH